MAIATADPEVVVSKLKLVKVYVHARHAARNVCDGRGLPVTARSKKRTRKRRRIDWLRAEACA